MFDIFFMKNKGIAENDPLVEEEEFGVNILGSPRSFFEWRSQGYSKHLQWQCGMGVVPISFFKTYLRVCSR